MSPSLLPHFALTPEQLKVVEEALERNQLVFGPTGSGKSQVLIHRAAYLAQRYNLALQDYLVFVFSEMAGEFIRPSFRLLGMPEEAVTTIDRWCRQFFEVNISRDLPRIYVNLKIDYPKIRTEVLAALKRNEAYHQTLAFAMVDDGQDFASESYEILRLIARHITVFSDFQQKIGDDQTSESFLQEILDARDRVRTLTRAHRNDPEVARLASYFISDKNQKRAFQNDLSPEHKGRRMPLFYIAPSYEEEIELLAAYVQMRLSQHERIGIIVPTSHLLHQIARDLRIRGVITEKVVEEEAQNVIHEPYDFDNLVPKITDYHGAKGLDFDTVFMPSLTEDSFAGIQSEARLRRLLVGMTRAKRWIHLSAVRGRELKETAILKSAAAASHLTII